MRLNAATALERFRPPWMAADGCKRWKGVAFDDGGGGGGGGGGSSRRRLLEAAADEGAQHRQGGTMEEIKGNIRV
jgi:hypothetical protein